MGLIIFISAALFLGLSLKNIYHACLAVIFLLPTYLLRGQFLGVPMTLLEIMIVILFFTWLFKIFYNYRQKFFKTFKNYLCFLGRYFFNLSVGPEFDLQKIKLVNPQIAKLRPLILFFLAVSFLGLLNAPDIVKAAGIWKAYFLEPVLFFIVLFSLFRKSAQYKLVLYSLSASCLVISLWGLAQKFFHLPLYQENLPNMAVSERITGVYPYPNALGLFVAPVVMLNIVWILKSKQFFNRINFKAIGFSAAVIVCGLSAIYFSKTEAALVALAAAVGLFFLIYYKYGRYVLMAFLVAGTLWGLAAQPQLPQVQNWWQKITLHDFSGQIRRKMYQETWSMLKDNFVFGAGLSGYQAAMPKYHSYNIWIGSVMQPVEIYLYPHNIFLTFWSELGLLGLLALILFLYKSFVWWRQNSNNVFCQAAFFSLVVMVVHGLVDVPYFKNDLAVLWWIIVWLLASASFDKQIHKIYN